MGVWLQPLPVNVLNFDYPKSEPAPHPGLVPAHFPFARCRATFLGAPEAPTKLWGGAYQYVCEPLSFPDDIELMFVVLHLVREASFFSFIAGSASVRMLMLIFF